MLRALGLWSREHYDVEIVLENDQPRYKKITFKSEGHAHRVASNLRHYGRTRHLPALHDQRANVLWVDYVHGRPCATVDDRMMPEIARCFGRFAGRGSRMRPLASTPYWQTHLAHLAELRTHGVIDARLHDELLTRSHHARPDFIRVGFDYRDPIGPNLLHRDGCGSICAIDVKNLHQDTLVGEGLAKASDRWLHADRRAYVFDHLRALGLADIESSFAFITLYERTSRVMRKAERDLKLHRRVRRRGFKRQRLTGLLDTL
ncbi:hypothetical protein [Salinisphaera sp. T31B1]|uniref:hypothetical protein n=1 Tax=Salinisphaera sp. T31B1 TaxID=727963 RepID=UPI003340C55D